jgi:hypothetical protein
MTYGNSGNTTPQSREKLPPTQVQTGRGKNSRHETYIALFSGLLGTVVGVLLSFFLPIIWIHIYPPPTACSSQAETPSPATPTQGDIYIGKFTNNYKLSAGIVDIHDAASTWTVHDEGREIHMDYPGGLKSGLVSITVGPSISLHRPGEDFSRYKKLSLELCGQGVQGGNEAVLIGLADNKDPHRGENRVFVSDISTSWKTFEFPLSAFAGVDLHNLYVVTEFIFEGTTAETVNIRNIQYLT